MISAFLSPEAFLGVVIQCRSAFWQIRTKYNSATGRKYMSDQDIYDCISMAKSITLRRYLDKTMEPLDGPKHVEEYFFCTLWTNISETYHSNVYHSSAATEFNEEIGNDILNPGNSENDLSSGLVINETAKFILSELHKIEEYDIEKRDAMMLNKIKHSGDPIVKLFAKQTIELKKKGYTCEKRILYIRSYYADDQEIRDCAIECMGEINSSVVVANLKSYATCKAYNKKYLETKTLYGLAELIVEGNSISSIAKNKGRLADPIRQKLREIKAMVSDKIAA